MEVEIMLRILNGRVEITANANESLDFVVNGNKNRNFMKAKENVEVL